MDNKKKDLKNYKIVWKYKSDDKLFKATIYEIEKGLLLGVGEGIQDETVTNSFFHFINEYSKKHNMKIKYITDNSKTSKITTDARKSLMKFIDTSTSPYLKLATVGDNLFVRSYLKLYLSILPNKVKINSFRNLNKAIEWIKK